MKRWNKRARPLLAGTKVAGNQLAVWCPYCRRFHHHGWWPNLEHDTDASHRVAHCTCDSESPFLRGGYYITVAPKTLRPATPEVPRG